MAQLVSELFQKFAYETGILGELRAYGAFGMQCLIALAAVFVLFGFKTYRAVFALLVFMAVALASCFLLTGRTDWGSIVTCFSVLGSVLAFMGYKWVHLGACIISGLVALSAAWVYTHTLWLAVLLCVLAIAATVAFPVICICLFTALWGSLVLTELTPLPDALWMIVLLCAGGFALQMLLARKQKLFAKKYPAFVTHWLEQRQQRKKQ